MNGFVSLLNIIFKRHINPNINDANLVKPGKITSAFLAIFAICVAPMVGNAPDGLYQLLQQLNGIFFIPVASIILAGFFLPKISALAAKVALLTGLAFYITCTFIFNVNLHFVHIWGIEFILNMIVMILISYNFPDDKEFKIKDLQIVEMNGWKHTKVFSSFLLFMTLFIYILLGNFNNY